MIKIVLACGEGYSSGFIASSMRKACKSKLVEAEVSAVGDIEIPDYIDKADVIMIGPHIKYKMPEFEALAKDKPVKLAIIEQRKYSMMDGAAILKDALALLEK